MFYLMTTPKPCPLCMRNRTRLDSALERKVQPESSTGNRSLAVIRESRIALQRENMSYGTRSRVKRSRSKAGVFDFGDELRAWRQKRNLSQSEAALRLQISKRTLQEWEQGRAEPEGLARVAIQKLVR